MMKRKLRVGNVYNRVKGKRVKKILKMYYGYSAKFFSFMLSNYVNILA